MDPRVFCSLPLVLALLFILLPSYTLCTLSSCINNNVVCDWDVCLDAVAGASKMKKEENPNCVRFDMNKFGPDSNSIFYGEVRTVI